MVQGLGPSVGLQVSCVNVWVVLFWVQGVASRIGRQEAV